MKGKNNRRLFIDKQIMLILTTTMKIWTRLGTDMGSCECGNEPPDSIRGRKNFNSIVSMLTRTASLN
jgi:hypothetical protein